MKVPDLKQSPGTVVKNGVPKIRKIHIATPVPEPFYNKLQVFLARTPFLWNISERLLLADIPMKSYSEIFLKISLERTRKEVLFQ